ncbi:MAG: glutamate-5-semialdehyde dehydrogenase [Candidatus Bathyarchaeia archaeon]|nr:glutamate-5-semialdehyde dehydrogenase [Candidatus Bathyarchaeota archaeon]
MKILEIARRARIAALKMSNVNTDSKNHAILEIAKEIDSARLKLQEINGSDVNAATRDGLQSSLLKRLKLNDSKIDDIIKGLQSLADLDDPVGKTLFSIEMDQGLELFKVSCSIGVIGAIFESRPDALVQISSLCLKSGNAVILKGGSEANKTNQFLSELIREKIFESNIIPKDSVQLIDTREDVKKLLELDEYVDLLIPRGSSSLVKFIKENSKIPVLGHTEGICHEYVDKDADLNMAVEICYDAKVQYPAVCNAMETLLVHKDIAKQFLPQIAQKYEEAKVELRGGTKTREILPEIKKASEKDWQTEYLDLILSIKIVESLQEAIDHINYFGSHHTDGIITKNKNRAQKFLNEVDSAVVLHNASTRFSDGYRFGFGAEVGISTEKIHARGPMGLEGLVSYKYIILGKGQIVSSYTGKNAKQFTHKSQDKTWNSTKNS